MLDKGWMGEYNIKAPSENEGAKSTLKIEQSTRQTLKFLKRKRSDEKTKKHNKISQVRTWDRINAEKSA